MMTIKPGIFTPQEFAAKYVTVDMDEYVCVVNDPRNPYNKTYTGMYCV